MLDRRLYMGMRILSALFNPYMAPFLAFVVLFFFTYLTILPLSYRLFVLSIVCVFTLLLPALGIYLFRRVNGWNIHVFRDRKKRYMPFLITILCYEACQLLMNEVRLPRYMSGIILGSLIAMIVSVLANFRWKISEHMVAMGGVVGGVVIFSFLLNYNPLFWLSFFIVLSGMLGSARIILKHHTLQEVLWGFIIGFVSIFAGIGVLFYW